MTGPTVLLVLDLLGTFAFAVNGGLVAVRVEHVDIVGVVTLGMITALGGGIIRDVLLGAVPPATFADWRYLAVAAVGGLVAFGFSGGLARFGSTVDVLDAAGLSLFAVTGAGKALALGVGPTQAVILGTVTVVGAALVVVAARVGVQDLLGAPAALVAAGACFAVRMLGLRLGLDAPRPPGARRDQAPGPT